MSHKKYRSETNCLNCATEVKGKFCPSCGQENLEIHENFFHVAGHFLSDYFHYDSKFFRSVFPLFTKPGFLTKEYWEGRRVRYIHPLRLYFFITLIFMISATYFYKHLEKERIGSFIETTVQMEREDSVAFSKRPDMSQEIEKAINRKKEKVTKVFLSSLDHYFHNLNYISFFLLPVYAMVFKILFFRRKFFYVDHLVYTLHLQSFVYFLIACVFSVALIFPDYLTLIRRLTILSVFTYIAFSFRFLYHQKWWITILKSLAATLMLALIMLLVFVVYMAFYIINY